MSPAASRGRLAETSSCAGASLARRGPARAAVADPRREIAQELEQAEVRARPRLELVHGGLHHGDRSERDRLAQYRIELAEGRLSLGEAAQVVLVEVQERRRAGTVRAYGADVVW
ncbi:MAG: hypothetical protein ACRDL4_11540 [Thermoleophilaceae bacterium]